MKKLFFAALLLFAAQITFAQEEFIFPKDADCPALKAEGSTLEDFVPKDWEIMDKTFGDLNGDGQTDCVIVVNGTDKKFIQKHDGFGVNPLTQIRPSWPFCSKIKTGIAWRCRIMRSHTRRKARPRAIPSHP
jgi:hypothetical protein